jgi:hypothetical protein
MQVAMPNSRARRCEIRKIGLIVVFGWQAPRRRAFYRQIIFESIGAGPVTRPQLG